MTVTIRERNNKTKTTWQVIIDKGIGADGKRKRESVTCETKEEAEEKKIEILHSYNLGTFIDSNKITVKDLCLEWFKCHVTELAPATQAGYKNNLEKHVYPYIGHVRIQKLTPSQVKDCYEQLKKKGLSPRSIHYVHCTLHEALKYAYRMQLIPRNVTEFVQLPKETRYKPTICSDEDIQAMLKACKDTDMEVPVNLTIALGLRRGELLGLKWEDIDFAKSTVHICNNLTYTDGVLNVGKPKTSTSDRIIVMPDSLVSVLKKHKLEQNMRRLSSGGTYKNNDLVVCQPDGNPIIPGSFSKRFSSFLKKNKLTHCRFHDLRHTNATTMLKMGVPMKIASERLGHSNIKTTMDIYTHVTPEMQVEAANLINLALYGETKNA